MGSFIVKENHVGSVVSDILRYTQTDGYFYIKDKFIFLSNLQPFFLPILLATPPKSKNQNIKFQKSNN